MGACTAVCCTTAISAESLVLANVSLSASNQLFSRHQISYQSVLFFIHLLLGLLMLVPLVGLRLTDVPNLIVC